MITPDKNISMLFKSGPGEGKTLAAISFAEYGDVYLAYFDKRTPIEIYTWLNKIGRKDLLERIEFDAYGSTNVHEYLNKLIKFKNDCRYVAVITDSVTNLTSAAVNWSMSFRDIKNGPKMDKLNSKAPQMIPDWDEYKVETSLVTQALDICKTLPVYNIWTAHPLPSMKIEGSGSKVSEITKTTSIVSYGSKVGAIVPANFTEIYHFGRQAGKRVVYTDLAGDDYAKSAFNLPVSFDITDKLFAPVWKELVKKSLDFDLEVGNEVINKQTGEVNPVEKVGTVIDPFATPNTKWKT